MAFKRTVIFCASFHFPTIRFDAPTLSSFSGCTHAHAKCPPVIAYSVYYIFISSFLWPNLKGSVMQLPSL